MAWQAHQRHSQRRVRACLRRMPQILIEITPLTDKTPVIAPEMALPRKGASQNDHRSRDALTIILLCLRVYRAPFFSGLGPAHNQETPWILRLIHPAHV